MENVISSFAASLLSETQKGQVSAAGVGDSEECKGQQLNVTSVSSLSVSPGLRVTGKGREDFRD